MTEIIDTDEATDILYNLFGYRRNFNNVDFSSLFENINSFAFVSILQFIISMPWSNI